MIVVEPNRVVLGIDDFEEFVGKELVDGDICLPQRAVKAGGELRGEREEVMEQRPQVAFAEAQIEARV